MFTHLLLIPEINAFDKQYLGATYFVNCYENSKFFHKLCKPFSSYAFIPKQDPNTYIKVFKTH